jgi:hypothetical protein
MGRHSLQSGRQFSKHNRRKKSSISANQKARRDAYGTYKAVRNKEKLKTTTQHTPGKGASVECKKDVSERHPDAVGMACVDNSRSNQPG